MQSQTSNGTVKLLVSDMQKAQRLIEAMRDASGASGLSITIGRNGVWYIDWDDEAFGAAGDSLDEAFAKATRKIAEGK